MEEKNIGDRIKILRKTRGLTQQQLADLLDIERASVSNYETGRRTPHLSLLEEIAKTLGVSLEYFGLGGNDIHDLIARAKVVFDDDKISSEEKARVYKELMKIYLDSN